VTIITKISEQPQENWNDLVKTHNFATFHQTTFYADYWKKTRGQPSFFVSIMDGDETLAQLLIHKNSLLQRKLESKISSLSLRSSFFSLIKNVKTVYVWEYGPLIFNQNKKSEIYLEINRLRNSLNGPINGSLHPLETRSNNLEKLEWKENKFATFLIDLSQSEEQLWKNIDRHSGRKAVNRALNKEVKIEPLQNQKDLQIHYNLLNEGRKLANLSKIPFRNIEAAWTCLKESGICGFIAWRKDVPLASTLMTTYNGYINEMGFARSKLDLENLYCSTDLIKWHIMKWGHENEFKTFDLSGVNPNSSDKKIQGIYKFKKKWGGTLQDWYHYTSI
jgi:hypothetical protein